jgi:hypothetical protein
LFTLYQLKGSPPASSTDGEEAPVDLGDPTEKY